MNKNKIKYLLIILAFIILFIAFGTNITHKSSSIKYNVPNLGDNNHFFLANVINFSHDAAASKNVQSAVDELYNSIVDGCSMGYEKGTINGGTYACDKLAAGASQAQVFSASDVKYDNQTSELSATNVSSAIAELITMVPDCLSGYTKLNAVSNTYDCKKNLIILALNQTINYGESISQNTNNVQVSGLLSGHSVDSITLTPSTTSVSNNGTITPSNISIFDGSSNNITSTYNISYLSGTLVINKGTCQPPTGVSVSCSGAVTWTASSNADSYEISIDGTTWETAVSGVDYNSEITASTGSRTVYVRSVCNSNNYNTPSTNATTTKTVNSVTLTAGPGISSVTGAGNYINGCSVSIGATISSGINWVNWTNTNTEEVITTTRNYTGTITSDWNYTANGEGQQYTVEFYLGNAEVEAGSTLKGTQTCTFGVKCQLKSFGASVSDGGLGLVFPYSNDDPNQSTDYYWNFYGWGTAYNSLTRTYTNGQKINPTTYTSTLKLYAIGNKNFYFYSGIDHATVVSQTQYWNPHRRASTSYRTTITIPTATSLSSSANGGWTWQGYKTASDSASNGNVDWDTEYVGEQQPLINAIGSGHMRAKYARKLIVSYNANGGTGTTANTTLMQYYNSGKDTAHISSNSITLADNEFTYTGYSFTKWAAGSANGTQYDAGATYTGIGQTVTSAKTVTMYAKWQQATWTRRMYRCMIGTWASNGSNYSSTCTEISQDTANSNNSDLYRTCVSVTPYNCGSVSGSPDCYIKTEYSRTGCSQYSNSAAYNVQTGLTECTPYSDKHNKVTCTLE